MRTTFTPKSTSTTTATTTTTTTTATATTTATTTIQHTDHSHPFHYDHYPQQQQQQQQQQHNDIVPQDKDILCKRGRSSRSHPGNQTLQHLALQHLNEYANAQCKTFKTMVVSRIVQTIERTGARFLQRKHDVVNNNHNNNNSNNNSNSNSNSNSNMGTTATAAAATSSGWQLAPDRVAREKVGQMLRDALQGRYHSSAVTKRQRRRDTEASIDLLVYQFVQQNDVIQNILNNLSTQRPADDMEVTDMFNTASLTILEELKRSSLLSTIRGRDVRTTTATRRTKTRTVGKDEEL